MLTRVLYALLGVLAIAVSLTALIPTYNAIMIPGSSAISDVGGATAGSAITLMSLWPVAVAAVLITMLVAALLFRPQPYGYGYYGRRF